MAADPHSANVSLLLHCDGVDGSTAFVDSGARAKAITASGAVAVTTARSKFGGASASFAGGHLTAPAHVDFAFGADAFTVEMWIRVTSPASRVLIECGGSWRLTTYAGLLYWQDDGSGGGSSLESSISVADGQWHHVAITGMEGVHRVFVDGALDGEFINPANYADITPLRVGAPITYVYANDHFFGDIDELRITKGNARYITSFTPPDEPFGSAFVITSSAAAPTPLGAAQALVSLPVVQIWAASPSPLVWAKRGTDDDFTPAGLPPTRFGVPMALVGMSPSAVSFQARSLNVGGFGVASLTSILQAGGVQSVQGIRLGVPTLRVALFALSLSPVQFGAPVAGVWSNAISLQPVRFGGPRAAHHLAASPLHGVRFGAYGLRLSGMGAAAHSLSPVGFGMPALGGVAMCGRTMRPARFGQPALDRGATC